MTRSTQPPAKEAPVPTGRDYTSVAEMLAGEGADHEAQARFLALQAETRISKLLGKLRTQHGITQQQMGERLGCTQSAISKLEAGRDEDLTLGQIRDYAKALDECLGIGFGRPYTHAEAINLHAEGMRAHLIELTKIARKDGELDRHVQAFFGEAFFSLLKIIATCQEHMPNGVAGFDLRIEAVSGKPLPPLAAARDAAAEPAGAH